MPKTQVIFYADERGASPVMAWIEDLPKKVQDKLIARVERLMDLGHELRRPDADYLRDDIHELRVRRGSVNYRLLYFFHEGQAVLAHGLTKERAVPDRDIELARRRQRSFASNPAGHTYAS